MSTFIHEAITGSNLSIEDIEGIDPSDEAFQCKLLGYYFKSRITRSEDRSKFSKLVFQMISTYPEHEICGTAFTQLLTVIDGQSAFAEGRDRWSKEMQKNESNVNVLENAASYLFFEDPEFAKRIYKQCESLQPTNYKWKERLAAIESCARSEEDLEDIPSALQTLLLYEKAYFCCTQSEQRLYMLTKMPKAAINAQLPFKTSAYAIELLELAKQFENNWNYGNAIYEGNVALGKVALDDNNLALAKHYLQKAGETTSSPQLSSFGPDLSLAQEFLARGERKTVLEFLEKIELIWQSSLVKNWIKQLQDGGCPDLTVKFLSEHQR